MDTSVSEPSTLSLHDALPILGLDEFMVLVRELGTEAYIAVNTGLGDVTAAAAELEYVNGAATTTRSEEHTSELQSLRHLVCRLLLEKKKHTHTREAAATEHHS